jgi:hypothetical protein
MPTRQYRRPNADDVKRHADDVNRRLDRLTADDLNAMDDQQHRRVEDRQRARAASMGLQLRKARTRNTSAPEHGTYCIADMSTDGIVAGGHVNGYGLGLDEVITFLSERA